MALLDFIELSDDEEIVVPKQNDEEIVDLSSDEETAEESHNDFTCYSPGQHPTTLHDGQSMFVAEGEGETTEPGNVDEATRGKGETTESGNVDEATPGEEETTESGNVDEATPGEGETTESGNVDDATPGEGETAESGNVDEARPGEGETTESGNVDEARPGEGETTESENVDEARPGEGETTESGNVDEARPGEGETTESGNIDEATPSSSVTGKRSLCTAASQNCPQTPTAAAFLLPTSISAEALPFEACYANILRAKKKRNRKLLHTGTPRRCPRLEDKNKGRRKSAEELAVDLKRSRLEEQSTSAASQNCPHAPAAATLPNLLRVEVKHRRKLVHTGTQWISPRLQHKNKGHSKSVVELALDLKRSRDLEEQNTSTRSRKKNKLTLCAQCRMRISTDPVN